MHEVENITNTMSQILSYEETFQRRRAMMEANKCRKCGEIIEAGDLFCDEKCAQDFYNTANTAELMALDSERGIEPVRNFADEAGEREDAWEARREPLRMDEDRLRDEAIELMVREPQPEPDEDRIRDEEMGR